MPRIALLDANVFFSPRMRDLFMHLREQEVIHLHWTKRIEDEWVRNVVAKQGADRKDIEGCLLGMRESAEDWEVAGFERYEESFEAVDKKDRHVAAAAYKLSKEEWPGRQVALVTRNVQDFPQAAFKGTQVTRFSMSEYLARLYKESPADMAQVVGISRKKLKNPKLDQTEYVAVLVKNGCAELAASLAELWKVPCPTIGRDGLVTYEDATPKRKVTKPTEKKGKVANPRLPK